MKCERCGAWTEVAETREADHGYTVKRTRRCANGHRFPTFEVLSPIYRNDLARVRASVTAAMARAVRWARNRQVVADVKTMSDVDVAAKHFIKPKLVNWIKRSWKA